MVPDRARCGALSRYIVSRRRMAPGRLGSTRSRDDTYPAYAAVSYRGRAWLVILVGLAAFWAIVLRVVRG